MNQSIVYSRKNESTEYIYYREATHTYPTHTHANHNIIGFVFGGAVCIVCGGEKKIYSVGQSFYISPDTPHAIGAAEDAPYSMITICVSADEMPELVNVVNVI